MGLHLKERNISSSIDPHIHTYKLIFKNNWILTHLRSGGGITIEPWTHGSRVNIMRNNI